MADTARWMIAMVESDRKLFEEAKSLTEEFDSLTAGRPVEYTMAVIVNSAMQYLRNDMRSKVTALKAARQHVGK